nr:MULTISPECIES: acyl-CoA dehydrogenase family protein [unclassified Sphingomonas]
MHDTRLPGQVPLTGIERVARIAADHADAVDREGRFPAEAIAALREEGLLGAMVPVHLGGHGATLATIAHQAQRLGRACSSSAMIYAMHQIQVACIVAHGLDQPWHRDFAGRIAAEGLLLASITSEVGIGGDMRSSLCAAPAVDGRVAIVKQAPTVSYGEQADAYLVTARRDAEAPASDQVLVTILKAQSRVEATGNWDALGMRGTCSTAFTFAGDGVAAQILPVPFAEIAADSMVPVSHLLWGAVWTGIAVEALSRARQFLRAQARRQPGVVLPGAARLMRAAGQLDLMQARLHDLIGRFDACHTLGSERTVVGADEAGWPAGMARAATLNTLKHDVSEMCHQVVLQALLICGMAGYKNGTEFSIGRMLRDILSAQLMISNDRIAANTGTLLLAQRTELGTL